jgi:hypothetical protein
MTMITSSRSSGCHCSSSMTMTPPERLGMVVMTQLAGAQGLPRARHHPHREPVQPRGAALQGPVHLHRTADEMEGRNRLADPRGGGVRPLRLSMIYSESRVTARIKCGGRLFRDHAPTAYCWNTSARCASHSSARRCGARHNRAIFFAARRADLEAYTRGSLSSIMKRKCRPPMSLREAWQFSPLHRRIAISATNEAHRST